ncbi:ABC transporter permease [Paenibacillus thalictri]|uniref:Sugar ABC transporter permease n=1 Tax=Paenibacillus thalictri TaxID=2527873 RepID=A0A4Q9DRB1_9BACL|nr:ABC transporter permease subunit [Paenibacillus thalictri]TBL79149.1 sugar ABC transporter permease [Paenibacillus thalictri]
MQAAAKSNNASFLRNVRKNKFLCLLALPGLLYFLIFKYMPMWGVVISFQDYSPYMGFTGSKWVGFEHFQRFFGNPDFWLLFRNTMAISVLNLLFFFPLPIVLSLLLNEVGKPVFKKTFQSVVYLPHFLSWVIIAGITFLMLSQSEGMVNKLLQALELDKVDFLTNPKFFWVMLTLQSIWKEAGWGTIIFLAAIAGIDPQLYEAARMDGASRFQQMMNITLPSIKNIIFILFILRLGNILDVGFEQVFLMMNGAVSKVGEVFDTYVYRVGIQQAQFSYSTAVGLFKSVIGFLLVISANKLAKKFGEEGVY